MVSSFFLLCTAVDVHFDIDHMRWTAYLELPPNVTITSPGKRIANSQNNHTINLVIEDYEGKMEYLPENVAEIFPNLKHIWIIDCFMKSVTKNNFKSLKKLQLLSILRNENFEVIEENTFEDLLDLRDLYLQSNSIKKLHPQTFSKLENLEVLDLSGNQLTTLSENIFRRNSKLEYLLINDNKLMTIVSETFSGLKNLRKIWLCHNEITHLPNDTFSYNENLTEIFLDGNEMSNIDKEFLENLLKLRIMSLAGNMLITFDFGFIESNENLFEISLSGNKIATVENVDLVKNMTKLYEINLANNSCVDQVFFGTSGEVVHKKMNQFKLQEKCSLLDQDSSNTQG